MSNNTGAGKIPAKPLYSTAVGLNINNDTSPGFLLPFFKFIIAALGAGGAVLSFFPVIMPHTVMPPVFLITAAVCAVCWGALYLGKWGHAVMSGMYIALGIFLYKMYDTLYLGYKVIFNEFYSETHMKQYAGVEFYGLSAYNTEELKKAAYTAIVFCTAAIALAEGTFIVFRTAVVPAFLVTLFPFEMTLYFGLVPNFFYSAAVICSWFAAVAAEAAELPVSGKDRRRSAYNKVSGQSALTAAAAALLCLAVAGAGVYNSGFERPDSMKNFRREFSRYMSTFSWDKFKNDLTALNPINPGLSGATNHGRLGRTDEITFTEENMLSVTLPKRADNVYIRGFIGSDYTGNSWTECHDNKELSQGLSNVTSGFETEGLQPLFFDGYNIEDVMETGSDNRVYYPENIFIEKKGANAETVYLPYFITPASAAGITVQDDRPLDGDNIPVEVYGVSTAQQRDFLSRHTFDEDVFVDLFDFTLGDDALYNDELRYREFVRENYLDITPEFTAAKAIYGDAEFTGLESELYAIRKWLGDNCSYDLAAGRLPFGKDFAQYFITESRKGSCTHFATAAALMCRYRGIPARYVEGYVIKTEDFPQSAKTGENVTIALTDERAHAWIEVYLDGYGWLPYEMTPGYAGGTGHVGGAEQQENAMQAEIAASIPETETVTETQTQTETSAAADDDMWEDENETGVTSETWDTEVPDGTPAGDDPGRRRLAPILIVIAMLMIPIAVAGVRYMNVTGARNRLLTGRNSRKKARAAGKYFMELCSYKNVKKSKDMSAEEFGKYAARSVTELDRGSAEIITGAALAADYSENFPDPEDADSAAAAAVRFAGKLWENMGAAERFVFKYIRCLK